MKIHPLIFLQPIAAQSVLQMLNYILPLMYGLLGAFIFVLRSRCNRYVLYIYREQRSRLSTVLTLAV